MEKYKHYTIENVGENVELKGWVSRVRNLGGLIFIDLRNRSGIMQAVVRPESKFYKVAESLRSEYVVEVDGKIVEPRHWRYVWIELATILHDKNQSFAEYFYENIEPKK